MSLSELAVIALAAILTSIIGGVAGYGTGLLMPLVLVPILGAQVVVPILGVSAIFNNLSRISAFRRAIAWSHVWRITLVAMPFCYIGATFYSFLTGPGASILIGATLILLVPARRMLKSFQTDLPPSMVLVAGALFGLVTGGVPGGGVILISLLMAVGLKGPAIVATDAVISLMVGFVKIGTFQAYGQLPASSWAIAALIGLVSLPGAFLAKWISENISLKVHHGLMDGAVVLGGSVLLLRGLGLT
ncbi:MAG: hypothetical protein JWN07_861 [Hyphomicrobiales bacterium]|nr:hypothetical protein [Hyphomicrobiales bacterium]